jgi:hypothetical protein
MGTKSTKPTSIAGFIVRLDDDRLGDSCRFWLSESGGFLGLVFGGICGESIVISAYRIGIGFCFIRVIDKFFT